MDTPDAEIYHTSLIDNETIIDRVTSDRHKSAVCESLGYHPSDLLQTNCIVWVEGPSDRIYLRNWIKYIDSKLMEGIHYSIMFYGGRLASHISGEDIDELVEDFISLLRLNRNSAIIIDSDKEKSGKHINYTKKRLVSEFQKEGFAWVTKGREIENYFESALIEDAIRNTEPSSKINSKLRPYDNCLSVIKKNGTKGQASKIKVADYLVRNSKVNLGILDLKLKVTELVDFIKQSNPTE